MSGEVIEVPPLRRTDLRRAAEVIRGFAQKHLGITGAYFPIVDVVENLLPRLDPDFHLEILTEAEMGADTHGLTIPSQHVIILRSDVYEGAIDGKGRDRMTVAHELGHFLLHDDLGFARRMKESDIKPYKSSEWQAKCFSAELLVSSSHAKFCSNAAAAAATFGVSRDAAEYQWKILKREGLV